MSTNLNFKVLSSTPNQKQGFVTKIQRETKANTPFGTKVKKETYYVSGTEQLAKDSDVEVNMDMFRVQTYPFMPDPATGEIMDLKWLHLK